MRTAALHTLTWATVAGAAACAVWLASGAPTREEGEAPAVEGGRGLWAHWSTMAGPRAAAAPAPARPASSPRR